jgi:hypothetical protein
MVEDEAKSMKELIESMQGPEDTLLDVQRKEEAMEDLLDRIDKIDAAINLHSLNGLIPAVRLNAQPFRPQGHQAVRTSSM